MHTRDPAACPLCQRVRAARTDPAHLASLSRSEVFLAPTQGAPGWCTLVLREHVEHLATLDARAQQELFEEVAHVAAAIRAAFPTSGAAGPPRINYECLGNVEPHVHWHVIPRHATDPTPNATVWGWTPEQQRGSMDGSQRLALARSLRAHLEVRSLQPPHEV